MLRGNIPCIMRQIKIFSLCIWEKNILKTPLQAKTLFQEAIGRHFQCILNYKRNPQIFNLSLVCY